MTELCLYHTPGACSRVTLNALEEAGFDYNDQAINIFKGEQYNPDYLTVNPKGKVPALKVGDTILTENPAILMYLHQLKPEARLLPVVNNAAEQMDIYSDLLWCSSTLHPFVRQVRMPMRFTDEDPSGIYAKGVECFSAALLKIEERLSNDKWWYGDCWSIMDVYLYWCYTTAASADFSLAPYPDILKHAANVSERASYQRALTRELNAIKKAGIELPGSAILT
tara:strand:+ start:7715 stop:8386 length:672 start_codon:yes stop_codon:yes gene_type:complete